MTSKYTLML